MDLTKKAEIPSYSAVEQEYSKLRRQIIDELKTRLNEAFPDIAGKLFVSEISNAALEQQVTWPVHENERRRIGWDWQEARDRYRRRYLSRIELAIWHDETLCGLMLGKPSQGRLVVKLNFAQSLPDTNPLKGRIIPICALYAELYAFALGCDWIGLQDPIPDPELIEYYKKIGFDQPDPHDPRNNALYRKIGDS